MTTKNGISGCAHTGYKEAAMAEKDETGSVHLGSKHWQRADTAHESGPWLYHQQMLGLGHPRDQAQDGMGAEKEEPQFSR